MQGKKDYQEKLFIRFQLSDYVPQDNLYRQLKHLLDFNFLYASTSSYYGKEGQKSIDPVVFMKLMLVGYLENLSSDRRIVATSRMRMDILYFIGYDLDEELPWHSTLSRTRQLYGEEHFSAIFKLVLKQCIDKGLVSGKRQAIDSAFVKANASMSSLVEREILNDASQYGKELDANAEERPADDIISLKQNTASKDVSKAKASKSINSTHRSTTDPDARMSVKPGKATRMNYLSQVSVDTISHVITSIKAFHADKGDGQCFDEMLKDIIQNLGDNGMKVQEILADTGYSKASVLQTLIDHGIKGYIPNASGYIENRAGFLYDKANDWYTCAQGKHLTFRHFQTKRDNTYKVYKTGIKDCRGCPYKDTCANPAGIKSLADSINKELYDQMYQRMSTKEARKMSRLRSSTVEPVLGTLINFAGMRQVNTKGIKLANKCMIMAAVAYNLKKLIKANVTKAKNRVEKAANITCNNLNKSLVAYRDLLESLIEYVKIRYKTKWLNNHLLYK